MSALINGVWTKEPLARTDKEGAFVRPDSVFRDWIEDDSSAQFPVEAGRYHLYVSYACPWACRTLMMRELKGLQEAISVSVVEPLMLENGWEFGAKGSDTKDPINHKQFLSEVYLLADSQLTSKVTVPVLWDKQQRTIVNNESSEIIRMLNSAFDRLAENHHDFYPEALREKIDEINEFVYVRINNGVYRCGFAKSQQAYNAAFDRLFSALDDIEQRLTDHEYLVGDVLTEADIRLFTTLVRFDAVYFGHFKCNKKMLRDYPNLSEYVRRMYAMPEVKRTVNFDHIKTHYYGSHREINPTGIVPKGPDLDCLM